jgi:type VI protein secretion system component VasF
LTDRRPDPLWQRLAWFVGLWVCGVAVVALVGYGIRLWLT